MKADIRKLKNIFTILIIVYPILSLYYSGFSSLTLADVLLLLLLVPIFFHYSRSKKISIRKSWIPFLFFLIVQFIVLNLSGIEDYGIMRVFRYMLYYMVIAVGISEFFDIEYGYKVLRNVSLFSAIFGIVQAIGLYVFGFYISGVLEFLPIMREELITYGDNYVSGVLRVRSVFGEPAHLATYLSVYLVVCLFNEKKKNIRDAIIVSVCLVFSVASTAYYLLLIIWGMFLSTTIFKNRKTSLNKMFMGIVLLVIVIVAVIILLRSEFWELFWNRNFVTGDSVSNRFEGYEVFSDRYASENLYKLWGHGYSEYKVYVNYFLASVPLLYWYMGYIGLALFIGVLIREFILCKKFESRMLIFMVGILGFATQIFISYNLMFYMAFVVTISAEDRKSKVEFGNERVYQKSFL